MGKVRKFACDFETTVYKGQRSTEVWSAAITEIFGTDESVEVLYSIDEFFAYIFKNHVFKKQIYYFHNLKFDGEFIVWYLLNSGYKKDMNATKRPQDMDDNSFNTVISTMNQWYIINLKVDGHLYIFRDSLKLLPFTLRAIGKSFKTKHQKTTMAYEGDRMPGYIPDADELEYIKNDVLVLREGLEEMFKQGYTGLTIGSCCLTDFKRNFYGVNNYKRDFPNLEETSLDESFGDINVDSYIRRAYRGGWCYTRFPGYEPEYPGETDDVNSLYPSVMVSGYYPYGKPHMWSGNYIPKTLLKADGYNENYFFYIRFTCRFKLRKGYLPFVSVKDSIYYPATKMLETSQIHDKYGTPLRVFDSHTGEFKENTITLTMSCIDFKLFLIHYKVTDFVIHDGIFFHAVKGIFEDYINYYMEMKKQATINNDPVKRQIAKLFLNNLYGKFAASSNSSYKECILDPETQTTMFVDVEQFDKTPGYIAIGAAVTAWARYFTITAAQKNYKMFRYADTDSLHLELMPGETVKGITYHDTDLSCWKRESTWDRAIFVRAKTYIEYNEELDEYIIKCAGLPQHCKMLFEATIRYPTYESRIKWLEEKGELLQGLTVAETEFLQHKHYIEDFTPGFVIPGKLMPVHIPGGVLLRKVNFTIR